MIDRDVARSRIYDVSVTLGEEIAYPGDPPFSREPIDDDHWELSRLTMSAHSGTHIDCPAHLKLGQSIDRYPPDRFILPARVIEVDGGLVASHHLAVLGSMEGWALLFRTSGENWSHLTADAASICVKLGLGLVGIDSLSVDALGEDVVHRRLMEEAILIMEGMDLGGVPEGIYTLICLPLKIKGGEASPVRAVLLSGR